MDARRQIEKEKRLEGGECGWFFLATNRVESVVVSVGVGVKIMWREKH